MNYDETLAFWYGLINYERRTARPGDLKLDRMRRLLDHLGNPQDRLRILHIAGTKGKGSTAAMLAAILQHAGYRTGLFTSPHLTRVEERFRIDGQPILPSMLAALLAEMIPYVRSLQDAGDPQQIPTFFEIGTALGFLYFQRQQVDLAIIEVGLGGRFDSTNVCLPVLSLITSISFDHMAQLGDKLPLIAREKAGILKPGRPAICTANAPDAVEVIIERAAEVGSPLALLGRDFHYTYEPGQPDKVPPCPPHVHIQTSERAWPRLELGLLGAHQAENAAGAVQAIEWLRREGTPVADTAVAAGVAQVRWPARLEVIQREPLILLDCAHNVASAQALVETLTQSFPVRGQRWLLLAISTDKDVPGMLEVLLPHFDRVVATEYRSNPRVVPARQLADQVQKLKGDCPVLANPDPGEALKIARQVSRTDDLIAISGSVFLAGELRPWLLE